jgi:hypothetical protein
MVSQQYSLMAPMQKSLYSTFTTTAPTQEQKTYSMDSSLITDTQSRKEMTLMIWARDFNRHHPLWDDDKNTHLFTIRSAEGVIEMMAEDDPAERNTDPTAHKEQEILASGQHSLNGCPATTCH